MISKIIWFFKKYLEGQRLLAKVKKRGLLLYLKSIRLARASLIGLLIVIFSFQLALFSFIGMVMAGIYLIPVDTEMKIWIFLGTCSTIFIVTVSIMAYALSEKTWLKRSGAIELLAKLD